MYSSRNTLCLGMKVNKQAILTLAAAVIMPLAFASPVGTPANTLDELAWRNIGPYRGGWSTVAVGLPTQPQTYFFGAAGGGVWKTTDAGNTWNSLTDHTPVTSVGALAVAPSNADVIYLGGGQSQARYDTAHGDGVYSSHDGGKTWQSMGLKDTRHIGDLLIDGKNPERVLVAALGPFYGASAARGVYLTENGGKSWAQTLKMDAQTGVVDLAVDAAQANVVFAASWEARNFPWMSYFRPMVGAGSGLYKSLDGGAHFSRIRGGGWPGGVLGRVGVAVVKMGDHLRVYALVDQKPTANAAGDLVGGGLFRSDDAGVTWSHINKDAGLASRYVARITIAPNDPDTVYVMNRSMKVSHDGGVTFSFFRGSPGGDDYHDLWINPNDPSKMVAASDQGSIVTLNGGATWSNWYNQPTGQFYCLHADNSFPYHLYSGQQDNGSVAITSRSDFGAISFRDWHPVGADERDCDVPDPTDPNIVYGSGLGGRVGRFDARTGDVQNITPVPINTYGLDPRTIDQRWSWITPLTISPLPDHALYLGSQQLYRSLDRGDHWQTISGDLTGRTKTAEQCVGDIIDSARARACGFGVIFTIAPSPHSADEVWVGTDSGLVQRSIDGGKSWRDVSPKSLSPFALISRIELSKIDRNTVYIAVDLHRKNIFAPMLMRSHDAGKTWQTINSGIAPDELTSVIRSDAVKAGLLFAGTDKTAYTSLDDGEHWQPLNTGLPSLWIRDMLVIGDDLAIASQGRGLWILDNVSRLRGLAASQNLTQSQLFTPATALRLRRNQNKDTPLPPEFPVGENPPLGAMLEYYLANDAKRVRLTVRDAAGVLVRSWESAEKLPELSAEQYFSDRYLAPEKSLSATAGSHRWLWDLRHARPAASAYEYSIAAIAGQRTAALPEGPLALPGSYQVELEVDGVKRVQSFQVTLDPRLNLDAEQLSAIYQFNLATSKTLTDVLLAIANTNAGIAGLTEAEKRTAPGLALQTRLSGTPLKPGLMQLAETLGAMLTDVESAERPPTSAQMELLKSVQTTLSAVSPSGAT